jgi:hypothetical protein
MKRIPGMDYLGGKHFEKDMLRAHPQGWCAGIFLRTFGDARSTVEKMARSGKFSEIVIHLAPFDKDHRYPISKLQKQVEADAAWCEQLARKYPGTKILISPFCEHNHPRKVMIPFFERLRKIAPSCLMVNSIWKGEQVPGVITEIHLENSKPKRKPSGEYIVAFDGFGGDGSGDSTDCDIDTILARYPDARQVRFWNFRFNGKFGHKDTAPVNKRKHWADHHMIRGYTEIMIGREGAVSWPKTALLKPFADDHGQGGKDNKLMCILPEKADFIEVLDPRGNVVDKMRRLTPDHNATPKGARYYSNYYAYQIGDVIQRTTGGSRLCSVRVKVGNKFKHYPLTDVDLRSGLFR